MKSYTFRVTQDLRAFYEGEVTILASSEQAAKNKLKKMPKKKIEELVEDWMQNTDNAEGVGPIEIQDLIREE